MGVLYEQIYLNQSSSLKVASYNYKNKSQCNIVSWHLHPEYELVFIRNGKGTVQLDTYAETYDDGLLIFLGPNIPHMPFGNTDFRTNVEVVIQFPESFVEEKLVHFPEFNGLSKFIDSAKNGIIFSSETHKKLSNQFLKLKNQNPTEQLLNTVHILYQLSVANNQRRLLKNKSFIDISNHSLERIATVYEFVNTHYAEHIGSEKIAQRLGLTSNSFCRLFKNTTNRSFISFLNEFRIKKAKEFFDNHDDTSISEAMYQCGFNDPSYFSKQFKKYMGYTPTQYRKRLLQL